MNATSYHFGRATDVNHLPASTKVDYGLSRNMYTIASKKIPSDKELNDLFNWYKGKLETITPCDLHSLLRGKQLKPILERAGFSWVFLSTDV